MGRGLPLRDHLMGWKRAGQASGDNRHRPISAGQVAANQGFSFPWGVIRQRVDVIFSDLVLVGEPHLVTPHECGIQQERVVGGEEDLGNGVRERFPNLTQAGGGNCCSIPVREPVQAEDPLTEFWAKGTGAFKIKDSSLTPFSPFSRGAAERAEVGGLDSLRELRVSA